MGFLKTKMTQRFISTARKNKLRKRFEAKRRKSGAPHLVSYFHQVDDPYSHLLAQILPILVKNFDVELRSYLVDKPSAGAAPEYELLQAFARRDAAKLAKHYGLHFKDTGKQPEPGHVATAQNDLTQALAQGDFVQKVAAIGTDLWAGQLIAEPLSDFAALAMRDGSALREKSGHYSGGMLHYGGEWYWGIDRLHFLEERLKSLGAAKQDAASICPVPPLGTRTGRSNAVIDFYASLRSPYTYVAAMQLFDLARARGATVNIKPVLPMVMRSLPVPVAKRLYIVRDVKRQADRLGIPFGQIADPVGKPVERGMAILNYAMEQGLGEEFIRSFLSGVWADGIDAGTDKGLVKIVGRAGLDWRDAKTRLYDESWREMAEKNREDMFDLGLWGVPSFRVGNLAVWGEDRLWQIEREL
jgi:2-hydroxychromene-2-carboxylate isomerase